MTTPDTELSPLIARLRHELALSQGQLAARAFCTRQYITQLEHGTRTRPSRDLATRLANALGLTGDPRRAFLAAAGHPDPEPAPAEPNADVSALAAALMTDTPYPSLLHDSTWTVRHANQLALRMFTVTGRVLDPGVSLLELVFDTTYRQHFPAWEPWARYMLAQFKRDSRTTLAGDRHHDLLTRLRATQDFARLWRHVDPAPDATPIMPVAFTQVPYGTLHFDVVRMQFVNTPEVWGVVFMPADTAARQLLKDVR